MSLTKATYSMIDAPVLNLKDYGAVGDGVANDTNAWLTFKAACVAQGAKGVVPAGTYLIDPFQFSNSDAGLVLEGPSFNFASASPDTPGPGFFGEAIAVFRARSASAKFVDFHGAYNLQISNISFDGNQFSDAVFYFDGTVNNTQLNFSYCEFYGATPTTGIVHHYAGTIGGDHCYFTNCFLYQFHNYQSNIIKSQYCVLNQNSNAFIINYTNCYFAQADVLIRYTAGSCNLYGCTGISPGSKQIEIINGCQPFICEYWYYEGAANIPFISQVQSAGATSYYPITIINPIINGDNCGITLTCQQPFNIYGGFIGGNIAVNPVATYGIQNHIIDSVAFNTGYGITGTGANTHVNSRNISVNSVYQEQFFAQTAAFSFGIRNVQNYRVETTYVSANSGAIPNVTQVQYVKIQNASPQNITNLNGYVGQIVHLYFADANSTLVNSTNFSLAGSVNVTPTAGSVITMISINSNQWTEMSRSIK